MAGRIQGITVGYIDMSTMTIINTQMYITGFQSRLTAVKANTRKL